jgi:Cys-tRNA(Pro)/Cys-tRNA(Cys) deacylase
MTTIPVNAPPHLLAFLIEHEIDARFIAPGKRMPTVLAAAAAIGAREDQILKTVLFAADGGAYVVAIANGTRRINRERLARATNLARPRAASPDTVFAVTGYPAGGVAPLGLPAGLPVIVDERVAAMSVAYGGGGTEDLLLQLNPADVIHHNQATVAQIVDES